MTDKLIEWSMNQGPFAVLLLLGLLALWKIASWVKPHCEKLIDAHLDLVSWLKTTGDKLTEKMDVNSNILQEQGERLAMHSDILKDTREAVKDIARRLPGGGQP